MISLLLPLRKNSKFFSKFLISYLKNTKDFENVELLILANEDEEWNLDFFEYFHEYLKVFHKDKELGRAGLHIYWNKLASLSEGDWLWYICDDFYLFPGYDEYLTQSLKDYDSTKPNVAIPRVDNSGSITHLLSRGYYEKVGLGKDGHMDSYINKLIESIEFPIILLGEPILHDFTPDRVMKEEPIEINISYPAKIDELIRKDAALLKA